MVVFLGAFNLVSKAPFVHSVGKSEVVEGPVHVFVAKVVPSGNPSLIEEGELELVKQVVDLFTSVGGGFLDEPYGDLVIVGIEAIDVFSVGQELVALLCD